MKKYLLSLLIFISSTALAELDYPTIGMVYNTKEAASILYDCSKSSPSAMECKFTQVSVRRKASEKDLAKQLREAESNYKTELKNLNCSKEKAKFEDFLLVIDGKKATTAKDAPFLKMHPKSKEDLRNAVSDLIALCNAPSLEGHKKIIANNVKKEMATCLVSSNSFSQEFKKLDDYSANKKPTWVIKSSPTGACGIVRLDRFEMETGASNIKFWNYIAKKSITNPKGKDLLLSCNQFDEGEYIYDWKSQSHEYIGCDHIEFSPI